MALAFRLFGEFDWPPTASPPDKKTVAGVLEIHYATGADRQRRPYLRWYPHKVDSPPAPTPPKELPSNHLFDLSSAQAADWFKDRADADCSIWLDAGGVAPNLANAVIFRGAFLFEQYDAVDGGDGDAAPNVQWPLVARCAYKAASPVASALGLVARKDGPRLFFHFHLPLPVRRTSLDGASARTFPFSAVYRLGPVPNGLPKIDTLVAGWTAKDALPVLTPGDVKSSDTAFAFDDNGKPETMVLGEFDFAEHGDAGGAFAVFNQGNPDVSQQYWPLNRKALMEDILWPLGFDVSDDGKDWLSPTNRRAFDSSLRFEKSLSTSGDATCTGGLIYRATVAPIMSHADGDLRSDGPELRLRLGEELGGRITKGVQFGLSGEDANEGWLVVGQELSADCKLAWEISRKHIWTEDRDADWSPTVSVRLHWTERLPKEKPLVSRVDASTLFRVGLLRQAAYAFWAARKALVVGEAGLPHSFLPSLATKAAGNPRFALYGPPLPAEFHDATGGVDWGRRSPAPVRSAWRRPKMRLSLADPDHLIKLGGGKTEDGDTTIELDASALTFFQTSDASLTLKLAHDPQWPQRTFDDADEQTPFFASFRVIVKPTSAPWRGRLSSLQFHGGDMTPESLRDPETGRLRIGGRGAALGLGKKAFAPAYPDGRIAAQISLAIPIAKVEPIGVDVARADRTGRPAPLLIPMGPDTASGDVNRLWLSVTETLAPTQDRRLQADILEDAQDTGERSYVVLSSEPFAIFRFTPQPLYNRGQEDSASVAVYSGDDRIWQYKRVADFYHYILPPQAVGESADKPRRLEIHDLLDKDTETPPRPFVRTDAKDKNGKPVLDPKSDLQRRAIEFKLTPPTELWIRPSDVERGYFMPESASYEIFRQFGAYGLGAALAYMRAEFLYGMPVGIDVSRERSIARAARVAEIEALTGRLAGPAYQAKADPLLSARWNALRTAFARRPERLEIWARDIDSPVDFTPARFSDGAQFALRHTALHRAPVTDPDASQELEKDYDSLPKVAGFELSKLPPGLKYYPRHHPQGLSGGALWPVESLNLFRTLLTAPQSNGGAIESIALSPMGGDAVQKAEFLGGKVTIISDTRNGYVQRQQVEVIGRICALWHRAKHVVVYERTVNPSAQFAPKFAEDEKRSRSRRPILRKVREYIELLQPERSYPDFGTATRRSAGFLERVRFNSKIINVDSAWGHDIERDGWEIPLWNRLSARERPQVYPRPDIAYVSTAEGDGEKPVVAQECLDPDYLFFFADFGKTTTADTDTWVSRLGLDYANMPVAHAIAKTADSKSSDHKSDGDARYEQRRPSVGRILPGLRRFTWRLAPAAQKAALNAGRADAPVYVGLDSVSFMRATHANAGLAELGKDSKLTKALELSSSLASKQAEGVETLKYWPRDGKGVSDNSKGYSDKLVALTEAIKVGKDSKDVGPVDTALKALAAHWTNDFTKTLGKELANSFKGAQEFLKGATFDAGLPTSDRPCDKLKADAVSVIKRKEMLIRTAVRDWAADAEHGLPDLTTFKTKKALIDAITDSGIAYLRPLFVDASQDVAKAGEGVEKARAIVLELGVEVDAAFARASQRIDQFDAGYDRAKPWSDERLKAFHAGLRACASNVASDVFGLIDEARRRFASELNEACQAIGGIAANVLGEIARTQTGSLSEIGALHGMIAPYLGKAGDALTALTPALDKALVEIGKAEAAIDKAGSGVSDDLKTKAKNVLAKVKTLAGSIKTLAAETSQKVKEADGFADEQLNKVSSVVIDIAGKLSVIVRDVEANTHELKGLVGDFADDTLAVIRQQLEAIWPEVETQLKTIDAVIKDKLEDKFVATGKVLDFLVATTKERLDSVLAVIREKVHTVDAEIKGVIDDTHDALGAVRQALAPASLLETVVKNKVLRPAVEAVLKPLRDEDLAEIVTGPKKVRQNLLALNDAIEEPIRALNTDALAAVGDISAVCAAVFDTVAETEKYLNSLAGDAEKYFNDKAKALNTAFADVSGRIEKAIKDTKDFKNNADALLGSLKAFDRSVRSIHNDLARSAESARMYADRVFDATSRIGSGDLMAAPSNVLKLYSAVTTAPEIAALQTDIDRIRSDFDELNDVIKTTKANALFNRLGDELKALGLSLPFDKIGDRLMPVDLSDFDIGKVFRNFGGAKLDNLLSGYKIPAEVSEAVRVTHDFDKKQARAWVQVDIDAPMSGRRSLFSVGVFKADFVGMRLTGQVRLEASKDQDKVSETGFGRIDTTIDMVVGGQSMVKFEKFALDFTKESGLKVEFDPKNIRLNPSFQYIQDFLATIFPDKVGGLEVVKKDGMPIGVQHDFTMPPISLNFGTSGVSNIAIGNHFKLLAFPDFMLANRFNLSTIERPFIFSIFIIGGTGYIQIEAEYRPFDKELTVIVEAGAGGSASLAFAFGPFVGQVFITLSGVLTYRKVIGKPGGGLSISAVLVIAGHVDVAGIATVGIVLMLRMSYRDNGQIDAEGSLTVEIRISRFFKITARANAKYKMRGGKSEVSTSADVKGEITDPALKKKYEKLQEAADKLKKART